MTYAGFRPITRGIYSKAPLPHAVGSCGLSGPFGTGLIQAPKNTGMSQMHAGQISPDKNVNFRDATAAFTVSPEPWASSCCADLPGDSALYAISDRRLIALRSGFLRTVPHGSALAFG